jgi:hypothetical protein
MMESDNSISQINELDFRNRYGQELRSKRQLHGYTELQDEKIQVCQQMLKTPGRRGEIIKMEEIEKEILRRYMQLVKY